LFIAIKYNGIAKKDNNKIKRNNEMFCYKSYNKTKTYAKNKE
jgi:hypothetical protein